MYQQQTMEDLKLTVTPDVSHLLTQVKNLLAKEGISSYLVGGSVRDMLLGRETGDIDIAVAASALEVAPRVAAALNGKHITLDEINEVVRVVLVNNDIKRELDLTTLKGNIEDDLAQRDFTIDAMAIELGEVIPDSLSRHPAGEKNEISISPSLLIDPFHGWDDLRRGVIRAVGTTTFQSDPARLLRAARLAAELDFDIDNETEALIQQDCHLITKVAGERAREELLRILAMPGAGQLLTYLDQLGLLTAIIPELARSKGVDQPLVHYWDVFQHSLQTVSAVEFVLRQGDWQYAGANVLNVVPWSAVLSQHFDQEVSHGSTRGSLLKLAALLHDIAKPTTKTIIEDGRAHFLGHPKEGAALTASILERLRFSAREIKLVELMVMHHLRPGQMSNYGVPSHRAIYRYFRDTDETGIDILFLSLADHLATRGPNLDPAHWQEHAQMVEYVLSKHFEEESVTAPPKLINGHDLIDILGLNPGPKIGELLEAVREAQAAGEVTSREEALDYVNHLLANPGQASSNNSA